MTELSGTLDALRGATRDRDEWVTIVDRTGLLVWTNPSRANAFGDAMQPRTGDVVTKCRRSAIDEDWTTARTALERATYRDSFGDPVTVESAVTPIFDGAEWIGHLILERILATATPTPPVEALRRSLRSTESMLRESQLLYRELFENSNDLIQSTNLDGRIMFVNDAWCARLGYSQAEASSLTMTDLLAPADHARLLPLFHGESGAHTDNLRFEMCTRHGTTVFVEGHVSFREVDGDRVGTHAVLRDITERERLDKMKDQFVSMVNHELRTPLTSIAGSLSLLQDGVGGELDEKGRRFLEIASRNVDRLTRLVQEVLDFERLSVGKLDVHPSQVSLAAFLEELTEDHLGFATARGVKLEVVTPADVDVEVDPALLRHVVGNFIGNALKFAPRGTTVLVGLTIAPDRARIWVNDRGPGIPVEFRSQMFDAFEQADGAPGGTGLGLNIARSIAELLGVGIGFTSLERYGATFFADIDATAPRASARVRVEVDRDCDPFDLVRTIGSAPDVELRIVDAPVGLDRDQLLAELATSTAAVTVAIADDFVERRPVAEHVRWERTEHQKSRK